MEVYWANCAEAPNLALEPLPGYEPLRVVARAGFTGTSSELLLIFTGLRARVAAHHVRNRRTGHIGGEDGGLYSRARAIRPGISTACEPEYDVARP